MDNPQRISPERLAVVFDDPIALNAHDYSTGNPELGWIEDGRHFVSKTRPTHASGQVTLDGGIVWGFVQSNALHTCGVRNVMFRDIYLHQPRTAFSVHYDIGKFSRSYYPGSEVSWQENLMQNVGGKCGKGVVEACGNCC